MTAGIFDDIRCVLLDIDGTLVDSNEFHVKAWAEAFERHGHPLDASDIRQQIGKGADQLIPTLRPDLPEEMREKITKAHDEIFRSRYLPQVRAFDGAAEFVVSLNRRGIKVVLASSANQREVDHYIELLDIENVLAATTCADDVENSKPARDIFAAALEKIASATADRALVIGDTPYDVIAATKCGIATVAVLSGGFTEEVLRRAGARVIYKSIAELGAGLDSH